MRMRRLGSAVFVAVTAIAAAGCTGGATRDRPGGATACGTTTAPAYAAPLETATGPCAPPPCAPPPPSPCEPPPCPPLLAVCGLPCEQGRSQFHVRGIFGWPTMAGDDAGDPWRMYGADLGTTRCGCVGFDLFYRYTWTGFDRNGLGEDGGGMHFLGVKATYERSIGGSNFYGYGGIGPEYFWSHYYLDEDSGVGGFAEAGVGYKFANWGRLRMGVDVHADFTSVGRQSPADDGDRRLLWTIAPVISVEFDF